MENREIRFRAIKDDISNPSFVYGQLVYDAIGQPRITAVDSSGQGLTFTTCIKGTIGQFIGLLDKNGNEIFEGDILEWTAKFRDTEMPTPPIRGKVKYNQQGCVYHINYEINGKRYYKELMATYGGEVYVMDTVEVVGDIHQHPELLTTKPQGK